MKFLLVLVVLLGAMWIWRRNRAEDAREEAEERAKRAAAPAPPAVQAPAEMVSCRHCGLHLPASDAVAGAQGHYCSSDHRRQHES